MTKISYNIAKKCSGDICTILHGQSKDGTKDIDIRIIEITLPDGKKEYLATNLFDKSITQEMFSELYSPPLDIDSIPRLRSYFSHPSDFWLMHYSLNNDLYYKSFQSFGCYTYYDII